MATFVWEAKTRENETRRGEMEAENADIVTQRLREQNLQATKVKKKAKQINIRMPGSTGIEKKDLVVFVRQFATMIDAGLPLVQCLEILGDQQEPGG